MTQQAPTNEKLDSMVKIVDAFFTMLFSKKFPDVQLAINCAKNVENLYCVLESKKLLEEFVQHMCKTLHQDETVYDPMVLQYACDVILETVLTDNEQPTSVMLLCANSYISLCGKVRFRLLLSKLIINSEVCRVLLDLVATTAEDSEIKRVFQVSILLKTLTKEGNEVIVARMAYDWLNSKNPSHMIIAFQAVSTGELEDSASKALLKGFISVLEDRQESSLLYWSTVISNSICTSVLKNSRSLFYASLDFLSKTAENFQPSPQNSWISQEVGPCHVIDFETLVKYLDHFISVDSSLAELVHLFLQEKCSGPGCVLWEDVTLHLPL